MRYGGDQEMIAALRLPKGAAWGAIGLYREPGAPMFSDAELGFVRRVSVAPAWRCSTGEDSWCR